MANADIVGDISVGSAGGDMVWTLPEGVHPDSGGGITVFEIWIWFTIAAAMVAYANRNE